MIVAVAAVALGGLARAQVAQDEERSSPRIQQQPSGEPEKPGIAGQGSDGTSLQIAPQPGATPMQPGISEIPSARKFEPSEESARLSPKFVPGRDGEGRPRACLGLSLRPETRCLLGAEEHGMEVTEFDVDGPAASAGFKTKSGSGLGAFAAGAALGVLGPLFGPVFQRAEHDASGDLLVAVDDVRVRSEKELRHELDKLRPGELAYVTVIRPLPGGQHQNVRIPIKVGELRQGECVKAPPGESAAAPSRPSRPGAESFAD
ncbi:MAG: PDZ domain-containing protein [Candidatus Binataceae bacterium]